MANVPDGLRYLDLIVRCSSLTRVDQIEQVLSVEATSGL